ncbi:hypothetical protein [Bacteriovorax sp. DB6_IX]|uniref:hypothetical protein n=1 Tax=Bacteriovorax sp. DB6_IX TaxID=1353530 RepID=UPI00038A4313|nr:hypothetical protein [Bacteriovorax sp. DB6_IX]EQC52578.1 hypothetical protein M901_0715 [Bacteriovorax sp. DB6_IX]
MKKFTDRFGLSFKILFLALVPFIAFNVIMVGVNYNNTKKALIQEKRYEIQDVIQTALGVLDTLE